MALMNGTDLRIFLKEGTNPAKAVAYATNCTIDLSSDTRSVVTKDTTGGGATGWAVSERGQKSGTISGEGLVATQTDTNTNYKFGTLFTMFDAGTVVKVLFTTNVATQDVYQADAIITALNISSPVEDNVTYTFTLTITGAVTKTTISA